MDKLQTRQARDWPVINNKHYLPGTGLFKSTVGEARSASKQKKQIQVTQVQNPEIRNMHTTSMYKINKIEQIG